MLGQTSRWINLNHSDLRGVGLNDLTLEGFDLSHCDFSRESFSRVRFLNCNLTNVRFTKAHFYHCEFENCDMWETDFGSSHLGTSTFIDNQYFLTCFNDADLCPSIWKKGGLSIAQFSGARISFSRVAADFSGLSSIDTNVFLDAIWDDKYPPKLPLGEVLPERDISK